MTPHRTDDEWLELLRDAHAARAALMHALFVELRDELGPERALELIGRACHHLGLAKRARYEGYLGDDRSPARFCRVLVEHSDVAAALFQMAPGPVEDDGAVALLGRCVLVDGWRRLGVPDDEIAQLCTAARRIDHGTAEGLALTASFDSLISEGDDCCAMRVRRPSERG